MHDVRLGLDILLNGPHEGLWDSQLRRETLRFLRKRGKDIPKKDLFRLVKRILDGPPRDRYRNDLTDKEWQELRAHQICLRLQKLIDSDATLPKAAQRVYERIQRDFPWEPNGDLSEEFPYFMSSGWVSGDGPGKIEDFESMSVGGFVQWASQQRGRPWECGGGWHLFFDQQPALALKLLTGAAEQGAWPVPPWYTALNRTEQTANISQHLERDIANTLVRMPQDALSRLSLQAARWLERSRRSLGKRVRQNLWARIWEASLTDDLSKGELDFDMTLNHPGGLLGKVLYDEMADYIPRVTAGASPGFPRQLHSFFDRIADGNSPSAKLARVRMAPMLIYLFRIDPNWTTRALFNRMDPDDKSNFDRFVWEGYLWSPRYSDDLLQAFRELFFKVLANLEVLPQRVRNHAVNLFTNIAIPPDRGITTNEAKNILFNMAPDDLADAAWSIKSMLQGAGDKSSVLWRETIAPWFEEAWPKRPRDRSPNLSEKLAWMAIDSGDAFPDVVEAIKDLLIEEKHEIALFHLAKTAGETDLVRRFPKASLTLAGKLVGDSVEAYPDSLREILNAIGEADSSLKEGEIFKRLSLKSQ